MTLSSFPKPLTPAGILPIGSGRGLWHEDLFVYLTDPNAEDWQHKTGVAGNLDGSAKNSLRLLLSRNWVFKTNAEFTAADLKTVHTHLLTQISHAERLPIWHPQKMWFALDDGQYFWPCTAVPRLTTLRDLTTWEEKSYWWLKMFNLGLNSVISHQISLDINPSNFGFDDRERKLYYLDEEIYTPGEISDIAEAVTHRIPQEPSATGDQWYLLGRQIGREFQTKIENQYEWELFYQTMRDYPLTPIYHDNRERLIAGIQNPLPTEKKSTPPKKPQRYCLLADIHSNLPALESVLKDVQKNNVEGYLVLGDIVGYGPYPQECLQIVRSLPNLLTVRGNHDHTVGTGIPEDGSNKYAQYATEWTQAQLHQDELTWLREMPLEHVFDELLVVHGSPQDPHRFYGYVYEMTYKENLANMQRRGLKVTFHGHNHIQFIYSVDKEGNYRKYCPECELLFADGMTMLVNPGSVGQPRDGDPRAAYAIWDQSTREITFHRVKYPINQTMTAIIAAGLPEMLASRLEVGR